MWNDRCVVESMFRGTTLPCDWLVLADDSNNAHMKGTSPGLIIGRQHHGP